MPKFSWSAALLVLILPLGLAACGNGDDTPTSGTEEAQDQSQDQTQADEPAASEAPPAADPDAVSDAEALGSDQLAAEETPSEDEAGAELTEMGDEEVAADTDTLGQTPADTLEEGAALPGETTRGEVDAMIEETERRFEEASRRIDEQFEAVEQAPMELQPMDASTDPLSSENPIGDIEDRSTLRNNSMTDGSTDVDAFLEEQERRFEEAERRLEEQFEEMEQGNMALEPTDNDTIP